MSTDVQEAFELNSVAAEKRYMRSMHTEVAHVEAGSMQDPSVHAKQQPQQLCSVVSDIETGQRVHILPRPVYSVSPGGQQAVSFDMTRLDVVQPGGSPTTLQCLLPHVRTQPAMHLPCLVQFHAALLAKKSIVSICTTLS